MLLTSDQENLKDEQLVKLTLADQENFVYLVRRYEQKLLRFVMRISGLRLEDAQDLLQEIFIRVYQNLNDFDTDLKFSSWIYRIARNQTISNYRKNKNKPQSSLFALEEQTIEALAVDFELDKNLDLLKDKELILATLDKLSPKYKEVMILKYFEDKSYEEISDIIKKPMGTVATLLNRAKKIFKNNFNYKIDG